MSNKIKALVTAEVVREDLEKNLSSEIEFVYDGYSIDHEVMPHEELKEKIKDYDVLICEYDTISRDIFENAERLKLIICCRGGVKSVIDIDAAMEHRVIVCNNAGRNAGAVTDMIIGYILDMTRNISLCNSLIHSKTITQKLSTKPSEYKDTVWGLDNNSPFIRYRGRSINHMTLGIVGAGRVGRELARKINAFDMNILVYDPYVNVETLPDYMKNVSWETLIKESDVISVNCALSSQTKNMFSSKVFNEMKDNSYFINTARGELVVEEDMVEALKSGKLAGAAIDVSVNEPISENDMLLDAPNLIITPHIGGSSDDVQICGTNMIINSLRDYLDGKKPSNIVVYI